MSINLTAIRGSIDVAWELAGRARFTAPVEQYVQAGIKESEGDQGLDLRHIRRTFGTENSLGYINGMERCVAAIHNEARRNGFWDNYYNKDWSNLNTDQKLNYTLMFLAANLRNNIDKLKATGKPLTLPDLNLKTHMYLGRNFSVGVDRNRVLGAIQDGIEYAWRNRQYHLPVPSHTSNLGNVINWNDALDWDKVSVVTADAVYASIKSLDELNESTSPLFNWDRKDFMKVDEICHRIQEHMTRYGLWGADNDVYLKKVDGSLKTFGDYKYPERTESENYRVNDKRQVENYVLLSLATLSAISDYMLLDNPIWADVGGRDRCAY